ncbi:hypothetical protein ACFMQL_12125 [Nonomuraea fastidiosa]|jgi:hypothetical protein|uniref:hypothetical protein n=1 Tax=Nonomuraea TaxID=83681 RepID=UPI003255E16E
MIRRILAGAAVAAAVFGFSASAASAGVGPNPNNSGQALLTQWQLGDDVLNHVLNHSVNDLEVGFLSFLDEINVALLNNNQPRVGDGNVNTGIDNGNTQAR